MEGIFNGIMNVGNKVLSAIISILPTSPVQKMLSKIGEVPYLNYINWFIPFDIMLEITGVWLIAVALFYLYMIILRWVKAIE